MSTAANAGLSPIDQAYGFAHAGKAEDALRIVVALLDRFSADRSLNLDAGLDAPGEPIDTALLGAELLANVAPELSKATALHCRDACIAAGDLPQAVAAAFIAQRADPNAVAEVTPIAQAFALGSPRIGKGGRTPPTLPIQNFQLDAKVAALSGTTLQKEVARVLQQFLSNRIPPAEDRTLPTHPLFSTLAGGSLARLLAVFSLQDVQAGEILISKGDDGTELFLVVRGMLEAFLPSDEGETRLAALGPGGLVGEMALVSDAPRAASVRAVEPTRVLVVSKAALEQEARREASIGEALAQYCRKRMLSNLMNHSFALSALSTEEKSSLLSRFESHNSAPGDPLVEEGKPGPGLFLIAAGHVRVSRVDADGDSLVVAELGPGEVVGEISLVLRQPASASVTATHATVCLFLPAEEFQKVVAEHPGLLQKLYSLAVNREDELNTVIAQQALDLGDITLL